MDPDHVETVVIGGSQAGLAVGYHLRRRRLPFVILDENERVGDAWRKRWDSLRLFTPARYSALPGMLFPGPSSAFPTKDDTADYLEAYAHEFALARPGSKAVKEYLAWARARKRRAEAREARARKAAREKRRRERSRREARREKQADQR